MFVWPHWLSRETPNIQVEGRVPGRCRRAGGPIPPGHHSLTVEIPDAASTMSTPQHERPWPGRAGLHLHTFILGLNGLGDTPSAAKTLR